MEQKFELNKSNLTKIAKLPVGDIKPLLYSALLHYTSTVAPQKHCPQKRWEFCTKKAVTHLIWLTQTAEATH